MAQVVSNDGGVLACALNAACAVLMDAGIPLLYRFGKQHNLDSTFCL